MDAAPKVYLRGGPPKPGSPNYRPANGPGWGGPAKGFVFREKYTAAEARARKMAIPKEIRDAKKVERAAKRKKMIKILEEVALDPKQSAANRINAVDKWLDRTEGRAVQPNANYDGGKKSLSELISESMATDKT